MIATITWLSIDQSTRKELANILNIPRSGGTEVEDNRVISDGYTPQDLATVTVEKLQEVLDSKEQDFYKLLETLISRIENPIIEEKSTNKK
jgi:hypothetical protein